MPEAMERVDRGGPTTLRAAAKSHAPVRAVADPDDYPVVLAALRSGTVDPALRVHPARKVFAHTSAYDAAIAAYLARAAGEAPEPAAAESPEAAPGTAAGKGEDGQFPETLVLRLSKVQDLRYGENPDQGAAYYAGADAAQDSDPGFEHILGQEQSVNHPPHLDAGLRDGSATYG